MRLVLVSGWAHPANALQPVAEALNGSHERCPVSITALGAAADSLAAALADIVNNAAGPCAVIGWSTGAIVTLDMLARGLAEPACTALISPTARFCSADGYPHGVRPSALRAMQAGLRKRPDETLSAFFRECAFPGPLPDVVIEHRLSEALAQGAAALSSGLAYLADTDLREALPGIGTPALVIHGEEDRIIPAAAGRFVADRLPSSELTVYDNAGHDLPSTHAERTAAAVSAFLKCA